MVVDGRIKMKDWPATAKNWMITENKFANSVSLKVSDKKALSKVKNAVLGWLANTTQPKYLQTKQNKDHNEPLKLSS